MPESERDGGRGVGTNPEAFTTTSPEQRQEQSNGGNPFSSNAIDEESVTTGFSEPPKTFADRLRRLIGHRKHASDDSSEFTGDVERDQIIKSLDQYLVGYPKVAAYENTDPNFLIYRKFGWLHNRILMYLQDELVELEYKLEIIDKRTFSEEDDVQLKSRRLDYAESPARRNLVKRIAEKLEMYGKSDVLNLVSSLKDAHVSKTNICFVSRKSRP
ncbi:MAG: hypothetical protein Q9181_001055 [Wetmoreana brouardii]